MSFASLATAAGMATQGYAFERTSLEVTNFKLTSVCPKAASASASHGGAPLRIAFMSDFHRSITTSTADIARAVALCNAQNPHVVLLGGDFISDDAHLAEDCAEAFKALKAPRGVFFVLGNHDHWHGPDTVARALRRVGLCDLTNRNTRLRPDVSLCGIDDCWAGHANVAAAFRGTERTTRVVLTHNPRIFPRIRDLGCVAICGHTHGGQIVIPFVPNPSLMSWKTYIRGWFHESRSSMYVNRGIGTLTLPIRFRCRPEITVLEV